VNGRAGPAQKQVVSQTLLQQSKLTVQAPFVGTQQKPETSSGSLLQTAGAQQSAERVQARCTPKQQTPPLQISPLGQSPEEVHGWTTAVEPTRAAS